MKRLKLKLLFYFLPLCYLLLLSGCSSRKDNIIIDLIVKGSSTEYWQRVYEGASAAAEIYGVTVNMYGPAIERNYRDQIKVIDKSIERKPDVMILAAGDYYLMAEPMERAVSNGIPVIMVDSAVDSDKFISFVTTDNLKAGKVLGEELLARLAGKKGKIGIVNFVQDAYPAVPREEGFIKVFKKNTSFELLETAYCDSDFDLAEEQTIDFINQNPDLIAIVGLNAQSATGAGRALKKLDRPDITLAGIDCTIEMAEYMEEGILDVAVMQQPFLMGYYSVETAIQHLEGVKIEENILTDIYIVDESNLFSRESQQLIFPFY